MFVWGTVKVCVRGGGGETVCVGAGRSVAVWSMDESVCRGVNIIMKVCFVCT